MVKAPTGTVTMCVFQSLVECRWRWAQPRLLLLPGRYDQLFQYYHSRACRLCHSVPKDPSVCLVCGTLVCLRENCCRQQAYYEAVHVRSLQAPTAVVCPVSPYNVPQRML